jgi:hypothetical protein
MIPPFQLRTIIRSLALVVCVSTIAAAQTRPTFTGEWVRVDSAPARPTTAATGDAAFRIGDMGSGWGSPLTIRQVGDSLIVEYVHFSTYDLQPKLRYTYTLNGTESVNRITIGHTESVQRSRVQWNGGSLVITTLHPTPLEVGQAPTETRQALSLDADGRLVIETTRPGARGPNIVRTSYTRR